MPPKKEGEPVAADTVKSLCALIATADEFKPNNNKLATTLGISHAKNVPRKFDSLLKPYGYSFKSGKIFPLDDREDDSTPAAPAKAKLPATPGASDIDSDGKPAGVKKTPTTPKTPKVPKTPKTPKTAPSVEKNSVKKPTTPKAKKRKVEEFQEAGEEADGEDDEAMKLIKEKMGGLSDDEADGHGEDEEAG